MMDRVDVMSSMPRIKSSGGTTATSTTQLAHKSAQLDHRSPNLAGSNPLSKIGTANAGLELVTTQSMLEYTNMKLETDNSGACHGTNQTTCTYMHVNDPCVLVQSALGSQRVVSRHSLMSTHSTPLPV